MPDDTRAPGQAHTPGEARSGTALRYHVAGMDCPSCAGKVETALSRLPGTAAVRINFQTQILAFELDEAATPRGDVEARIRALGYGMAPVEAPRVVAEGATPEPEAAPSPWLSRLWPSQLWADRKLRLAALLGALLAAGFAVEHLAPALGALPWWPAAALGLWVFGRKAIALARSGSPFSIEMLMSIATLGALAIGAASEAAMVVFLFTIGEVLEGVAAGRARSGIAALGALVPRQALKLEAGVARPVPAATLRPGDTILVRPGDRIAADGVLLSGESEVDESPITGESIPVARAAGDAVRAGSVNGGGVLEVRVERAAEDNTIARIIRLVEQAQEAKAPTARFIERFAAWYTPAAAGVALLVAVLPPLLAGGAWDTWLYRALALLLVACPCALVLSTPAAIASGLAAGTRRGLLVKGGAALETIGRVRAIAFDKTGTLTEGRPRVTDTLPLVGPERPLLGIAASAESGFSHPLGRAIQARAAEEGMPLRPVREARALPGRGVEAVVSGKAVVVSAPFHAATLAPLPEPAAAAVARWEAEGKTVVVVTVEGTHTGLIAIRDEPRADAAAGIAALRALGLRPVMLTGDNPRTGAAIAATLGIAVQAGLLPEEKQRAIAALEAPSAMVGDGINDAPALAAASVGIAMGGGTDVALETADAALLHDRVLDVAALVGLSRATLANIRQNVAIALGLKAVFLVTTVAGLTGLWPAVLADTGATVLVTLNALRLLRHRFAA